MNSKIFVMAISLWCLLTNNSQADWTQSIIRGATNKIVEQTLEETLSKNKNKKRNEEAQQIKRRIDNAVSHTMVIQKKSGALGVINAVKSCYKLNPDFRNCIYMDVTGKYNEDLSNQVFGFPYNDYYMDNTFFPRIEKVLMKNGMKKDEAYKYLQMLVKPIAKRVQEYQ